MLAAIGLILAAASARAFTRRRAVYALGPLGPWLAPAYLWTLWYAFLWIGHAVGSLAGAGIAAAAPLFLLAYWARGTKPRKRFPEGLTLVDRLCWTLISVCLLVQPTFNFETHLPLIATYLRGNVPPCDFNDPSAPINYHVIYSASAALFAQAFGLSADFALDAVSATLLAALIPSLQAVSRILFRSPWAGQACRIFFLFGLGPIYLRPGHPREGYWFLHGWSNQSFMEAVLRPTAMLNLTVFAFLLGALLPRIPSHERPQTGSRKAPHPAWLLPAAFMLPQASEELSVLAGLAIAALWAWGKFPGIWALGGVLLALVSASTSGVVREVFFPNEGAVHPGLLWQWPPILLCWAGGNMPLFSWGAVKVLFWEWGPVYAATLAAAWPDLRRRVGIILFVACFGTASLVTFGGNWSPQDFDRLFFFSTPLGFMLAALWIERIEKARAARRLPAGKARWAAGALAISVVLGPVACALFRTGHFLSERDRLAPWRRPPPSPLVQALAPVGARELILTDKTMVRALLLGGFVTVSPPFFHENKNLLDGFDAHLARFRGRPDWLFLPKGDPRAAGPVIAAYKNHVLTRPPPMDKTP